MELYTHYGTIGLKLGKMASYYSNLRTKFEISRKIYPFKYFLFETMTKNAHYSGYTFIRAMDLKLGICAHITQHLHYIKY